MNRFKASKLRHTEARLPRREVSAGGSPGRGGGAGLGRAAPPRSPLPPKSRFRAGGCRPRRVPERSRGAQPVPGLPEAAPVPGWLPGVGAVPAVGWVMLLGVLGSGCFWKSFGAPMGTAVFSSQPLGFGSLLACSFPPQLPAHESRARTPASTRGVPLGLAGGRGGRGCPHTCAQPARGAHAGFWDCHSPGILMWDVEGLVCRETSARPQQPAWDGVFLRV